MAEPRGASLDPKIATALRAQLGRPPLGVKYPIKLTAQNSFLSGRAALAFVSPHLLIPADDVAAFGSGSLVEGGEGESPYEFEPPHQDARIVAWFHPPEVDRTYVIDFSIVGSPGSYALESDDGTETTQIPEIELLDFDKHLSTTFHTNSSEWLPFTLSGSMYWTLNYCELNMLP
jgi:hypothetical protein